MPRPVNARSPREPCVGHGLVVADVHAGVLEAEPPRTLYDGPEATGGLVRCSPQGTDPGALAEECDRFSSHGLVFRNVAGASWSPYQSHPDRYSHPDRGDDLRRHERGPHPRSDSRGCRPHGRPDSTDERRASMTIRQFSRGPPFGDRLAALASSTRRLRSLVEDLPLEDLLRPGVPVGVDDRAGPVARQLGRGHRAAPPRGHPERERAQC